MQVSTAKEVNLDYTIPNPYHGIISKLVDIANKSGYNLYAVGGFVRDLVTTGTPKDLDILVDGPGDNPAIEFVKLLHENDIGNEPTIFERFGVGMLIIDGVQVEFVMPRQETYTPGSRKPEVGKATVEEDAARRDFTVNTLMIHLNSGKLLDPTGRGVEDLKSDTIRAANPDVDQVFTDDPLRMLRAIRFMVTKNMEIDPETLKGIERNAAKLKNISAERIKEELERMLLAEKPSRAIRKLQEVGLLREVLPELEALRDSAETPPYHVQESTFDHVLRVLDNIPPDITSRLSALLHDIGKPASRSVENEVAHFFQHEDIGSEMVRPILRRLKFPNEIIDRVKSLVGLHMRPRNYSKDWSDKAMRKFLLETGELLSNLFDLVEADIKGSASSEIEQKNLTNLQGLKTRLEEVENQTNRPMEQVVKPVLDGYDLMTMFNVNPKSADLRWIGQVHKYLKDVQLEKPDLTREEAESIVKDYVSKNIPQLLKGGNA